MQQYVTLYLSSLINLFQLDRNMNGDMTASIVSIFTFALSALTPTIVATLIYLKQTKRISNAYFDAKLSSLTDGLSYSYWNAHSLLKWTLTISLLVTLSESPSVQITLLFYLSVVYQGLILKLKPFSDPVDNYLAFFNEFLISLTL